MVKYIPVDGKLKPIWRVGDECTLKKNFRMAGFPGGWAQFNYAAIILKVNKRTLRVVRVGWWDENLLVPKEMVS